MRDKEHTWHQETINEAIEHALHDLNEASALERFYLAGGTGLALQLGHRRSLDLDFFCDENFDEEALLPSVQHLTGFSLLARDVGTLHAQVKGIKVSFLAYPYPLLFGFRDFQGVKVADPRDIACMKISTIAGRGTKRDYVDLYVAASLYGLGLLLGMFKTKYAQANYSLVHVLKSLTYFEEADKDPDPDTLTSLSWNDVKEFFTHQSPRLL